MNTKLLMILFFGGSHYLLAMESIITSEQKMVTIQCCNKNCKTHILKRWQIFESIPLHMYCLKNNYLQQKDIIIKLPSTTNISCEKMNLFSKALDYALLSKMLDVKSKQLNSKELFKEYFEALIPSQQRLLIITAGRLDENRIKQLHSPMLCAQLVDVYFKDKEFLNNKIKSLIHENKLDQEECYISKIINYNLKELYLQNIDSQDYVIYTNERGWMNKVPSFLAEKDAVINREDFIDKKLINKVFRKVFYSKNVGDWQYYVTNVDEKYEKFSQAVMLWSINSSKSKTMHTMINLPDTSIPELKHISPWGAFSRDGKYLLTVAVSGLFVTKILPQEDGTSIFNTYPIKHDIVNISGVRFNNDDTQLIVSSYDDIKGVQGKLHLFKISGEHVKTIIRDEIPYGPISSQDRKKLLVFSAINQLDSIKYSCNLINDTLEVCAKIPYTKRAKDVVNSLNCWAVQASDDSISLITTRENDPIFFHVPKDGTLVNQRDIKMLLSSDGKSLVVFGLYQDNNYSDKPLKYVVDVFSTITGKKRSSVQILSNAPNGIDLKMRRDRNMIFSCGLTPKDHELVLYAENDHAIYKKPFFSKQDQEDVNFFLNTAPVSVLAILRRLYVAQQNKDTVVLYEEEPAYKILQALNKSIFIKKCLCFSVTDNKKDKFSLLLSKAEKWCASLKFS